MKLTNPFLLLILLSLFCCVSATAQVNSCLPLIFIDKATVSIIALEPGQVVELSGGQRQVVPDTGHSVVFENVTAGRHRFAVYPSETGRSSVKPVAYAATTDPYLSFTVLTVEDNPSGVLLNHAAPITTLSPNLLGPKGPLAAGMLEGSDYLKSDETCFGCYTIHFDKKLQKNVAEVHPAMGSGSIYRDMVAVSPNTWYVFSVDARSLSESGRKSVAPLAGLLINGADATEIKPLATTGTRLAATWYSGSERFATLELRNQMADPSANATLVEKISFSTCTPPATPQSPAVITSHFRKQK